MVKNTAAIKKKRLCDEFAYCYLRNEKVEIDRRNCVFTLFIIINIIKYSWYTSKIVPIIVRKLIYRGNANRGKWWMIGRTNGRERE